MTGRVSLRDHLSRRAPAELWISEGAPDHGAAVALRARLDGLSGLAATAEGRRVALRTRRPEATALALLLLDGVCDSMLLVHPETDDREAEAQRAASGAELVVTDDDLAAPGGAGARPRAGGRDTAWIIPTSGTTGRPKLIRHTLASLTRTARPARAGEPVRWGMLYGLTRFAGLQVFLQALVGGGVLLFPASTADLPATIAFLAAERCGALSATPTMWRKLLMTPGSDSLALRQVTLGGEIADQAVLDALRARYPHARVVHIYASTEAGVGFSVKDGRAGFPAAWLRDGNEGVELRVQDGTLRLRVAGELAARRAGTEVSADADGFVDTGDLVEVGSERVRFLGRANGTINVGGNKVPPEEVEAVLLAHPGVALAAVRSQRSPFTGSLVVADVVLKDASAGDAGAARELLAFCRARLAPYKVPARIRVLEALDLNGAGKIARGG